VRVTLHCTC